MLRAANGAESLLGIIINEPPSARATFSPAGREFSSGRPPLGVEQAIAAPADLASAEGGAGLITGQVRHACTTVLNGAESALSAWTDALTVSLKDVDLTWTPPASGVTRIYRKSSTDGGATWSEPYRVWTDWDDDGAWTDNYAIGSTSIDYSLVPPAGNQIGTNYGFRYGRQIAVEFKAEPKPIESGEMGGGEGLPEAIGGEVEVTGKTTDALTGALLVPILGTAIGAFTRTPVSGEPTVVYDFDSSTGRDTPIDVSFHDCPGGSVAPALFYGFRATQLDIDVARGQVVRDEVTYAGKGYSLLPPMTPDVANTGTYAGMPLLLGGRFDASDETGTLYAKITTAPSAGTFAIKCKKTTAAAYGSTATTVTYDTTDKKQTRASNNTQDYVEVLGEDGLPVGLDTDKGRYPLGLLFHGDTSLLALNDVFSAAPAMTHPTIASLHRAGGTKLTMAHGQLTKGGASLRAYSFKLSIKAPMQNDPETGMWAMYPADVVQVGSIEASISLVAAYRDRAWERLLQKGTLFSLVLTLSGPPIIVNPGVYAANGKRESCVLTFGAAQVQSVSAPRSGNGETRQTVNLLARQPANGDPYMTAQITTAESWTIPS